MCGIVGAISLDGSRTFPEQTLDRMSNAIRHRGPDDGHSFSEPGISFAARRLAIIDVAHGRQPIANEDGQVQVAFNGELFDYPVLREELLKKGHQLKTHCDTEAWAHLYEEYGEDVFLKARGQFAACIWDRKQKKLLLGRDRAGISPLYYTVVDNWLLWSSEIRGLLATGMVDARPDRLGLDFYFNFFCLPSERTCFEGIQILSPGYQLKVQNGKIEKKCYWDLDFPDAGSERRFENSAQAEEELGHLLQESVRRRLISEVPVCCYLSGGLDSTTVLGLVTKAREQPIQSFTISLDRSGPVDERDQAVESAEILKSPLEILRLNSLDIANAFPEQIVASEGPVFDTSSCCLMLMAKRVREMGYKVALTGEGADELLAGYVWFRYAHQRQIPGRPGIRLFRRLVSLTAGGGRTHQHPMDAFHGYRIAQQSSYELIGQSREVLYSQEMWKSVGDYSPYQDVPGICEKRIDRWEPLNRSLYAGFKIMLPGLLLAAKSDRVTMNSSVEGRYPFLDEAVVDFCASIDPKLKLRGKQNKWLLRQVAARTLPPQIANRPKTMFRSYLMANFLKENRPPWVDQLLSKESIEKTGYFQHAGVERARHAQMTKRRRSMGRYILDMGLMAVLSTQLWHHLYIDPSLADLPDWTGIRHGING